MLDVVYEGDGQFPGDRLLPLGIQDHARTSYGCLHLAAWYISEGIARGSHVLSLGSLYVPY